LGDQELGFLCRMCGFSFGENETTYPRFLFSIIYLMEVTNLSFCSLLGLGSSCPHAKFAFSIDFFSTGRSYYVLGTVLGSGDK
jgi:hypothetical protein